MEELIKALEEFTPYDELEKVDKEVILDYIKKSDKCLTRDDKIAHITTSAWIVNKERTKVLMIYHNIYQSWAWVGGHADGDSDLKKVILKEIEEETGVKKAKFLSDKIYGVNIVTVDNHIKRGKQVNSHLHLDIEYVLEADEKETIRIKEDENSNVDWIPIEKVEEVTSEIIMKPVYRRLNEKLKGLGKKRK